MLSERDGLILRFDNGEEDDVNGESRDGESKLRVNEDDDGSCVLALRKLKYGNQDLFFFKVGRIFCLNTFSELKLRGVS